MRGSKKRANGGLIINNIEMKHFFGSEAGTELAFNATGTGGELSPSGSGAFNTQSQGDAYIHRSGRKAWNQRLRIRGSVSYVSHTTLALDLNEAYRHVELIIIMDTQANGVQAQSETVFKNPSGQGFLGASRYIDPITGDRFKVLWKKSLTLTSDPDLREASFDWPGSSRSFEAEVDLKDMPPTLYNASTGDISDIVDNAYHLYGFASGDNCYIAYNSHLEFIG